MTRARPWIVVGAAFASMFTVFGVAYSFGAFFDSMAADLRAGHGATGGFLAVTAFAWFTLGAVTGPLADRLGPRPLVVAGAAAMGLGLLATSLVHQLWLGYLAYGLGVGVGTACGYVPMVAAVGGWFGRGRAFAIGLSMTGIGFGTLVVPLLAALLIQDVGWRRSYQLMAVAAAVLLLACAALTPRPPAATAVAVPVRELVRSRAFQLLFLHGILLSFGQFFAFGHLAAYAAGQGARPVQAAALIGLIGLGSAVGRIFLGLAADRLGTVAMYKLTTALMALSFSAWLLLPGYGGLVVFALAMGVGYGGWVALAASVLAEIYGPAGLGGSVGALYTCAGVGGVLGSGLGGVLVDVSGGYAVPVAASLLLGLAALGVLFALPSGRPVNSMELRSTEEVG